MKRNVYLILAGVVLLIALVSSVFVVETSKASKSVTAEVTAFTLVAPYTVTFEVDKPPAESVTCEVAEIDFRDQEVGDLMNIKIGTAKQRAVTVKVTVPVKAGGKPNQPQVVMCDVDRNKDGSPVIKATP